MPTVAACTSIALVFSAVRGPVQGTVLCDGIVCGVWHIEHHSDDAGATLVVEHVVPLTKRAAGAIAAEGERYLGFVAADVSKPGRPVGRRNLSLPGEPVDVILSSVYSLPARLVPG